MTVAGSSVGQSANATDAGHGATVIPPGSILRPLVATNETNIIREPSTRVSSKHPIPLAQNDAQIPTVDLTPNLLQLLVVEPASIPLRDASRPQSRIEPRTVMPGFSAMSLRRSAAASLDSAAIALSHGAPLSGAADSIESLRKIAQAIDIQNQDNACTTSVDAAMFAMREAEDFVGRYGIVDSAAIARMVDSHQTPALKPYDTSSMTGIAAADVYLDWARATLARTAQTDPLAAHAIAMLAKSYRQRADESPIALAASVHLMRAASMASPRDAGLATELSSVLAQANLPDESRVVAARAGQFAIAKPPIDSETEVVVASATSRSSGAMQNSIKVEQLTPDEFARISRSEAGPVGNPVPVTFPAQPSVAPEAEPASNSSASSPSASSKGTNPVSRAMRSFARGLRMGK